ncbi:MAG TPA: type 4a pilus biogenesis protein PilO [Gammaproteobacteria bacterium]|nr:type 4a pilus biogenesis protein PilO [Gammaproteobacteria bacterium]
MSIIDDLRALDTNDPGRWPLPFRIVAVGIAFVAVVAAGFYFFVLNSDKPLLDRAKQQEVDLRLAFEDRQHKAANFDSYRSQLAEIERDFGAMLRQLPGKTEVPSLLVDISQTALGAGLEEKVWQPTGEIQKDFYAELPIKLRYTGSYHDLGRFVSGIAALPRIVTLHDIDIKPAEKDSGSNLTLDVTAKTYRYLDEPGTEEK